MLMVVLTHTNQVAFQSLPFSHAHGLVTFSQAIWARKTLYAYNCHIPHTCANLSRAIRKAKPQIVWTVPYVLKLLCETEEGIDALKGCETVSSSGSRCPDEIGDYLTSKGIFLGLLFGS
jgi:acyl-coenzyme A synthetase/AMP-(fatty) acid ligase